MPIAQAPQPETVQQSQPQAPQPVTAQQIPLAPLAYQPLVVQTVQITVPAPLPSPRVNITLENMMERHLLSSFGFSS